MEKHLLNASRSTIGAAEWSKSNPPEHLNQTTPSHKLSLKPFRRSPQMLFYCAPLRWPSTTGLCNTLSQHSSNYKALLSTAPFSFLLHSSATLFPNIFLTLFLVLNTKTPVSFLSSLLMLTSATTQKVWYTSGKCIRPGKCLTRAYEVSFTLKLILTLHLSMARGMSDVWNLWSL